MFLKKIIACSLMILLSLQNTSPTAGNFARLFLAQTSYCLSRQLNIKETSIKHDLRFLGIAGVINQSAAIIAAYKMHPAVAEGLTSVFDIATALMLTHKAFPNLSEALTNVFDITGCFDKRLPPKKCGEDKQEENILEEARKRNLAQFGNLCAYVGLGYGGLHLLSAHKEQLKAMMNRIDINSSSKSFLYTIGLGIVALIPSCIISTVWPLKEPKIISDKLKYNTAIQTLFNVIALGGLYATHKTYQALPLSMQQVSQAGLLMYHLLQLFDLGIPYDPLNKPALLGIAAQALSYFGYVQDTQLLFITTLGAHYLFVKHQEEKIEPKKTKEPIENRNTKNLFSVDNFRKSLDDIYRIVITVEEHAIQSLLTVFCLHALKHTLK